MNKIFIFGNGSLADLAEFYFSHVGGYEVCGRVVDAGYVNSSAGEERPLNIVPSDNMLECYPPDEYKAFVAIGYSDMNRNRKEKMDELMQYGYQFATYVDSSCKYWEESSIGQNCLIMENVSLQPFVQIGDGCILCAGCSISHHSRVDDYAYIGSNAVVAGNVKIGSCSFIGVGAVIRDAVDIAPFTLLGAGAYVAKNTKQYGVYGKSGEKDSLQGLSQSERQQCQTVYL